MQLLVGHHAKQVAHHLALNHQLLFGGVVRGPGHRHLAPEVELLPFVGGNTEQLADHEQRKRHREFVYEIDNRL